VRCTSCSGSGETSLLPQLLCAPWRAALVFAVVVATASLVFAGSPALTAKDDVSLEYKRLVVRYAVGDRDGALAALMAWPSPRVLAEVRAVDMLGAAKRRCDEAKRRCEEATPGNCLTPCPGIGTWTKAALMMHTDAATLARRAHTSPAIHRAASLAFGRTMMDEADLRPFVEKWYFAVAADRQGRTEWGESLAWAGRGLKVFPNSVDLRLVIASVEETLASLVVVRLPDVLFTDPSAAGLRQVLLGSSERRTHLERAKRPLDEVVKMRPDRLDAKLHLGRVTWRLGRPGEAREILGTVLASNPAPSEAYIAHLSLGQILEEGDELEAAARAYSEAVALDPQCQAARLALSHAQMLLGDVASARPELERAVSAAGRRSAQDAFWLYPWGPSAQSDALLAALRLEAAE
jgi:tetratricopeptide (TPR) repeat protein